jgi:amidase
VADAAVALGVVQSRTFDGRDPATGGVPLGWQGRFSRPTNIPTDYTQFLDPNGLRGAKIGVTRVGLTGFTNVTTPPVVLAQFEAALKKMTLAGATLIDLDAARFAFPPANNETLVLCFDFRNDLQSYFATRVGVPMAGKTLNDGIAFNNAHANEEMPFFNQDLWQFCASLAPGPNDPQPAFNGVTYNQALAQDQNLGVNGIDLALTQFGLDAIVTATDNPAWATDLLYGDHFIYGTSSLAAPEGYPIVQVPAGIVFGVPLGVSFFGTAFSEPKLIKLASGFEAVTQVRAHNLPTFARTVPFDHISGTTLQPPRTTLPANSRSQPAQPSDANREQGKETKRPHYL